jgi:predicted nucleic acid-binding protein
MRHDALVVQRMASVAPANCAISTITTYELYTGVEKCAEPARELAKLKLLLATVRPAAMEAARIRALLESQGCMIGAYDVLWRATLDPPLSRS